MTDTKRPWDRLTTESDPAYEAFAAYLETGRARQRLRRHTAVLRVTPPGPLRLGWLVLLGRPGLTDPRSIREQPTKGELTNDTLGLSCLCSTTRENGGVKLDHRAAV